MPLLVYATIKRCPKAIGMLLTARAAVNSTASAKAAITHFDGHTSLMRAALSGHEKILELLLHANADPMLHSPSNETAYDLAAKAQHPRCATLLKAAMGRHRACDNKHNTALAAAHTLAEATRRAAECKATREAAECRQSDARALLDLVRCADKGEAKPPAAPSAGGARRQSAADLSEALEALKTCIQTH